jgi:hypothetical protein
MLETRTGLLCQLDGAYVSYFEVYVSEIVRPLSLARSRRPRNVMRLGTRQ